jgi:type II secretory pathway pseudopilin PulG
MAGVKVKASTLVETMVAMVILCLVMGTAMVVFINATSSSISYDKVKAGFLVNNAMEQTQRTKSYVDEELEIDHIKLIRQVAAYGSEGLVMVEIKAFNPDNKLLATAKSIFSQHE